MNDDEYDAWEEWVTKATASADDTWHRALADGQDIDPIIAKARRLEAEALQRGHRETAKWWEVVGTVLHHRQQLRDELACQSIEDAGLVSGVWPDSADQALDWNEIDDWEDGPDLI